MRTKCSLALLFLFIFPLAFAKLTPGFYSSSCPQAESIVFSAVRERFGNDKSITGALLRMHFHDCFSGNGCDASILINSTKQSPSEKDSGPNLTVRGYELVDQIKTALEAQCHSTVSCADIIALATRDAVFLAGGLNYTVPTGRLDGLRSNPDDVNLPGPSFPVPEVLQIFSEKGFTPRETVALLGAHTVGVVHCSFFQDRLFENSAGGMDPALATELSNTCGATNNGDPLTDLDHGTPNVFDNGIYSQMLLKRGVLQIDQELAKDATTSNFVGEFANDDRAFQVTFADAMIKLGGLQDPAGGGRGEVRNDCRVFNPAKNSGRKPVKSSNKFRNPK